MPKTNTPKSDPKCPVSREDFAAAAKPIMATLHHGDQTCQLIAPVHQFKPSNGSFGSFGWYANEKAVVMIDGVPCKVQVSLMMTLVGSKERE